MVQPCPAKIGDTLDDVVTPALIVDLDAYERNLGTMAALVERAGLRLRPHAKTHKSPEIALAQMARGAVGACCQKLSEAEILAQGGVGDILIANQVVGAVKAVRAATLAQRVRLALCVDHPRNVEELSTAARTLEASIDVLVEIDVGNRRCGLPPGGSAVALAERVAAAPGLRFLGLQAYHGGAQHIRDFRERRAAVRQAAEQTLRTVEALEAAGLDCETVTGGGTGTLLHDIEAGALNELQAGSYVFMDADYGRNLAEDGTAETRFESALFVLATVMSHPNPQRAVLDAGLKALAMDSGPPLLKGVPGATYTRASDEHGVLDLERENLLAHGQRVLLIPGHCDPTVNLYDWYVGVRRGRVEQVWPVAARGALA